MTYSADVCWFPAIPLIFRGLAMRRISAIGSWAFRNCQSIREAEQPVSKQQGSTFAVLDTRIGAIAYVKPRYPIPVPMLSGGALEGFS